MSSHDARYEDTPARDESGGSTRTVQQSTDRYTTVDGDPVLLPVDAGPEPTSSGRDTTPDSAPVTLVDGDRSSDYARTGSTGSTGSTDARIKDSDVGTKDSDFGTKDSDFGTKDSDVTAKDSDVTLDRTDRDRTDRTDADASVGPDIESGALKDPVPDGTFSTEASAGSTGSTGSGTARGLDADWRDLQGRFVDDPQAAVREAAALVEKALTELRTRAESGSTEDLRTAFRRYRDLYSGLR